MFELIKWGVKMNFYELIKRNLKIYFRDKSAVFFSLLSMIVTIILMLFFLSDFQIDAIVSMIGEFPGRNADSDKINATVFVLQWIAGGIVGINAVTVTIAFYSAMIRDRVDGRLNSIYTAPVSRFTISAAYVTSAWICSVIICILTLAFSELYCIIKGADVYSFVSHIKLIGIIAVNSFTYSALMYLLAMLVATQGAWGGLGTVIGTTVGFLGGIYLPIGDYSETMANIIKFLPVIYGTKLFRTVMTEDVQAIIFKDAPAELINEYRLEMGVDLEIFSYKISDFDSIIILLTCGIVFLVCGAIVTKRAKKSDK